MLRHVVLRVLAFAAIFAVVWLAPSSAKAAIVPVCDADAFSGVVAVTAAPLLHAGDAPVDCPAPLVPLAGDEDVDPQIAAMCDVRGATAIAPARVHPMTDARIDAVVSCDGTNLGPLVGPSHGENGPGAAPWAVVDHAVLTISYDLRPTVFFDLLPFLPAAGEPRVGFGQEIDHPPRLG